MERFIIGKTTDMEVEYSTASFTEFMEQKEFTLLSLYNGEVQGADMFDTLKEAKDFIGINSIEIEFL